MNSIGSASRRSHSSATSPRTMQQQGLLPVRPGVIFGGVDERAATSTTYGFGTVEEPFPQGDYDLWRVLPRPGQGRRGMERAGWGTRER